MSILEPDMNARLKSPYVDKGWIRQELAKLDALTNEPTFELEPGMSPEILKERMAEDMRARGIDPDSIRYPQDEESYYGDSA